MNIHSVYTFFSNYFRKKRMKIFEDYFKPSDATKVLDVGGSQFNWSYITVKPKVTILNISRPHNWDDSRDQFTLIIGDGTNLEYRDESFDIAYSNSVIEHLGTLENQKKFALEVRRVGKGYYVQTPAREFFFEPHLLTPFIHWLSRRLQRKLVRNFSVWGLLTRPSQQFVDGLVDEIRLLTYSEFKQFFPDALILREKAMFFTKSYVAIKIKPAALQ